MTGPSLRTDLVLVVVFRTIYEQDGTQPARAEFLQLLRSTQARSLPGTWHPVMGQIETDETAPQACRRELLEEVGLERAEPLWQLDGVHPFYLASRGPTEQDAIYLAPGFATRVGRDWTPTLNEEHDAYRWVSEEEVDRDFVWPFQAEAIREVQQYLLRPTPARELLRLTPPDDHNP